MACGGNLGTSVGYDNPPKTKKSSEGPERKEPK